MGRGQVAYKERILALLETFPTSRLRSILDYVEYLKDREAWEETQEILADKDLMAQLEEADRDWKGGNYQEGDYVDRPTVRERV
ncbi:MAG: hypothetical protein Q8P59_14520 [Dehalococcoidia bacterium]|nr:hypothetical protein [Dehalococcoidia bacterium]